MPVVARVSSGASSWVSLLPEIQQKAQLQALCNRVRYPAGRSTLKLSSVLQLPTAYTHTSQRP